MKFLAKMFSSTCSYLFFISAALIVTCSAQAETKDASTRIVKLSGNAFVTHDMDASIDFYLRFLGFEVYRRFNLDAPASREVYGVTGDEPMEYAVLIPSGWPIETPGLSGLNFAQIKGARKNPTSRDEKRTPVYGEFILTYEVTDLEKIAQEMSSAGVPIVTPLKLSSTGKSKTLTVIDPNGIRVHMYDYIK